MCIPVIKLLLFRSAASPSGLGRLVQDAEAVLRPADQLDLQQLVRTFTLRTSDGFVENFGPRGSLGMHPGYAYGSHTDFLGSWGGVAADAGEAVMM